MKKKIIIAALAAGVLALALVVNVQAKEANYIDEDELQGICEEVGEEFGICPELLQAIVERESSGNILAVNGDCKGLTQISECWHKDRMLRLGVTDLFDPKGNIRMCADYLLELKAENDDLYWILMHYNMKRETASKLYEAGNTQNMQSGSVKEPPSWKGNTANEQSTSRVYRRIIQGSARRTEALRTLPDARYCRSVSRMQRIRKYKRLRTADCRIAGITQTKGRHRHERTITF